MTPVAVHPEAGAVPEEVRWVVTSGSLPARGTAVRAPDDLAALLAHGVLTEVRLADGCVVTRASCALDWRRIGPAVRRAVTRGLAEPERWEVTDDGAGDGDRALVVAARALIDGDVGDYVRSHGGSVEIVDVRDGVVGVRLAGACHGCPASELTLRARVERRLREECPALVAVVAR